MAPTAEKEQKLKDSNLVDWAVFSEILQMDEDEEGFSQQLVETFVSQVEETFDTIQLYLKEKDLEQLSSTGHFLKGSAAALGLTSIASQCERIQNYGHKHNFDDFQLPANTQTPDSKEGTLSLKEKRKEIDEKVATVTSDEVNPHDHKTPKEISTSSNGDATLKDKNTDKDNKIKQLPASTTTRTTTTPPPKSDTKTNVKTDAKTSSSIPDELSDDFWILLIEDALSKAKDGFVKSKKALDEFFE